MTLSDITRMIVRPSITALDIEPGVGDEIDFLTPAETIVRGAMVTAKEYFCGEMNYFVNYTFEGYDGRLYETTGWVAGRDVL